MPMRPAACLLVLLAAALSPMASRPAAAADACDRLAARMIRATGASVAGRIGPIAVFRAADAERMSLDCRKPARLLLGALEREPEPRFFTLVGLAAEGLAGVSAEQATVLALNTHQDSLLADAPREGRLGRFVLRCETGPRADALAPIRTVCLLTAPAARSALPPSAAAE
ncbi:hypothetical protein [Methylobacterium sp. A54F]